jgi:hypothetical protein
MHLSELIPVLSIAIGPVILISGVGLLLLSMTNRLGRTIDRVRDLLASLPQKPENEREQYDAQLGILWRRAKILRTAISLAAIAALLAAILIIILFIGAILKLEIALVVITLFIACMVAVIASLIFFIRDIEMSLRALAMEMKLPNVKRE